MTDHVTLRYPEMNKFLFYSISTHISCLFTYANKKLLAVTQQLHTFFLFTLLYNVIGSSSACCNEIVHVCQCWYTPCLRCSLMTRTLEMAANNSPSCTKQNRQGKGGRGRERGMTEHCHRYTNTEFLALLRIFVHTLTHQTHAHHIGYQCIHALPERLLLQLTIIAEVIHQHQLLEQIRWTATKDTARIQITDKHTYTHKYLTV